MLSSSGISLERRICGRPCRTDGVHVALGVPDTTDTTDTTDTRHLGWRIVVALVGSKMNEHTATAHPRSTALTRTAVSLRKPT